MNEEQQLIGEMARRMLDDHCGPAVVDRSRAGRLPLGAMDAAGGTMASQRLVLMKRSAARVARLAMP